MRASTTTTTLLTLALVACSSETSTPTTAPTGAPALAGARTSRQPVTRRPFSGTCEAQAATRPVFTPPILTQLSIGTCQLSHLGRVEIRTLQRVNTSTGAQTAEITYTAANGDQLFATNVGTSTPAGPATLTFVGTNTITGGTGRFANATGQFDAEGTANLATGAASFSYDGWIAYDASDRSGQ